MQSIREERDRHTFYVNFISEVIPHASGGRSFGLRRVIKQFKICGIRIIPYPLSFKFLHLSIRRKTDTEELSLLPAINLVRPRAAPLERSLFITSRDFGGRNGSAKNGYAFAKRIASYKPRSSLGRVISSAQNTSARIRQQLDIFSFSSTRNIRFISSCSLFLYLSLSLSFAPIHFS